MEQDVSAARGAGDAKSHSLWAPLLLFDRLPDRLASQSLLIGRESRALAPWGVYHVASKEESSMRCGPRGRLLITFRDQSDGRQGGLHVRGQNVQALIHAELIASRPNGEVRYARKCPAIAVGHSRRPLRCQKAEVGLADVDPEIGFLFWAVLADQVPGLF